LVFVRPADYSLWQSSGQGSFLLQLNAKPGGQRISYMESSQLFCSETRKYPGIKG